MIGKWVLDFMTRPENRTKVLPSLICCPNMEGDEWIFKGFTKLETYGNNQLHVVIARIREAFCIKFDERLARNYFIHGEKGQPYIISLDQELIKWED